MEGVGGVGGIMVEVLLVFDDGVGVGVGIIVFELVRIGVTVLSVAMIALIASEKMMLKMTRSTKFFFIY